ncbi:hypothetical protein KFK09_026537 [Dendrobium nobile]|uniref:DUF4283 domain-containing protein n=1 Tax=Dendrobium nobile TaxID=94219 RepID=A0A8T3A820_DENNO|nr:hypothetical protein KFK09_026537 [Dendrobium nobile]
MALLQDFPPLQTSSLLGSPPVPLIPPPSSYAANLAASSSPRDDWSLSYSKPAKKLSFAVTDLSEGKSLWSLSLVGYSLGPRPYYERLRLAMEKAWKLKGELSLLSLADDFFLLKFNVVEDYEMVSAGGPWFLLGKPFILQKWDPKFQPKRDESAAIPLWIKILNLPLALWTPAGISRIASYIGIPLYVDNLTAKRTRLTFARVCVEVDKNSVLVDEIPLEIDGTDLNLKVVYDWKPSRCEGCGSLIHSFALCSKNPNPKPTIPQKMISHGRSKSRAPTSRAASSSRARDLTTNISAPPTQILVLEPAPETSLPPSVPTGKSLIIPNLNLNLPQADSFSANLSLPSTLLLPPQVVLANSFQALPIDTTVIPDDDPTEDDQLDEETSSSSKTGTIISKQPSNNKPSTSSSSKVNSPPKKGKAKSAKKAKPHK